MNQKQGEATRDSKLPCGNLLVGVTGSVGAVAVPQFLFLVRHSFAEEVHVMMSRAAQKFLSPFTLRLFSGNHVFTDSFQTTKDTKVPHIELTRRADLLLIMPATANIMGKAANGICDDLISTSIVACKAPVVFVPSMNETMWSNIAVQQNVQRLKAFGHHVLDPSEGYEICDLKETYGVMPTFVSILDHLVEILAAKDRILAA